MIVLHSITVVCPRLSTVDILFRSVLYGARAVFLTLIVSP